MRKTLLNISYCIAFIAPFVFATTLVQAAGPNELKPGNKVEYPTWHLGKSTKFCVQNLDNKRSGKVHIRINEEILGNPQEDVQVASGDTKCIDRQWGGVYINVTNSGKTLVNVWTE